MLTSVSTEDLIPPDHPIRKIRVVVDAVLGELDPIFDEMYATSGRRSVPPEMLLKATVLMAMYSIRSERAFCERLNYDLLFKWFLDMRIDQPAFDATTFTKNRQRLLDHDVADEFFAAVVRQAKLRRYISSDHFSVDGTLLNAWASHKSFKPKDGPPSEPPAGRNVEVQWHGQKRSNDTHASTTDPEARLYRKSNNTAATLCYAGHLLIEHRSALISLVSAGAAMLLGTVMENEGAAGGLGVGLGLVLAALGGAMMPLEFFPDTMRTIANVTPHAWGYEAFAEIQRREGTLVDIAPQLGVLAAMAALLLALGAWSLRRSLDRPM